MVAVPDAVGGLEGVCVGEAVLLAVSVAVPVWVHVGLCVCV